MATFNSREIGKKSKRDFNVFTLKKIYKLLKVEKWLQILLLDRSKKKNLIYDGLGFIISQKRRPQKSCIYYIPTLPRSPRIRIDFTSANQIGQCLSKSCLNMPHDASIKRDLKIRHYMV